ncbi:hypothetical protein A9993_04070 [Rahnella victoriana]|uniref:hypothetical protein n=1 Tax=Rahnella victoriana TaxID=1510570 RepID=UPI000BB1F1B4|nr:hypothetical protein [Rahnella victoriana]PBI78948.1 hypothetical protein A9993_04070 [Rahnella victoriana]
MSEDSKSLLKPSNGIATGGLGAVLTLFVPAILPDPENVWRPALYALAPLISAAITYPITWLISRHGFESPAEATLRNKYSRDLKSINKQLKDPLITENLRLALLEEREKTVLQLVNIGKTVKVSTPQDISPS